ncbi:MAG: DUF3822 family protein [Gilvibacter sp.]
MTLSRTINSSKDVNSNKRLSVQVSLTGLSFLLETSQEPSIYKAVSFDSQLNPAQVLQEILSYFKNESFLQTAVKDVRIVYHNKEFALVPNKVFDANNLAEYLKYNARLLANDFLDYDQIDSFGITNVYVPYTNVNNFFFDTYGDFIFEHSISVYLKATQQIIDQTAQAQVFLEKQEDDFILAAYSKGQLQLANVFPHSCKEDLLYYLLFSLEQLAFDPDSLLLHITGGIQPNDAYYDLIYTYIRYVNFTQEQEDSAGYLLKNCWL